MPANPTDPNIIRVARVRLSYPQLWVAKSMQAGQEPKFGATFLLDKVKHKADIALIEKTIERVALDEFKKKITIPQRNNCLHDGNEKGEIEGYGDGIMFLVAKNNQRPAVVGLPSGPNQAPPQLSEADGIVYAGCYVNVSFRLFAWKHDTGGKGVSASLRAVQFVEDGESFGAGKVNAETEFDGMEAAVNLDDF